MKAILSNKRKHPKGHYIVDITCPDCDGSFTVGFAGWTGLVCQHCLAELERSPYRSAISQAPRLTQSGSILWLWRCCDAL